MRRDVRPANEITSDSVHVSAMVHSCVGCVDHEIGSFVVWFIRCVLQTCSCVLFAVCCLTSGTVDPLHSSASRLLRVSQSHSTRSRRSSSQMPSGESAYTIG